jgi:ribonuclease BN (tRNA processing enzyme)
MTSLTIRGSGAAVPNRRRGPPGLLFKLESGAKTGCALLVDPGPGALHRAVLAGVGVEDIAAVFLTHHHPDHTIDLMSLLFARHSVLLRPKLRGLALIGPAGTRDLYERMTGLYGRWVEAPPGDLAIVEIGPPRWQGETALPKNHDFTAIRLEKRREAHKMVFVRRDGSTALSAGAIPVAHADNSTGYRFEFDDGTVGISGDSEVCPGLVEIGREADILVLESSVPDEYRGTPGHMCPAEAGEIAARAGAQKLVLYHMYPPVEREAALRSAQESFKGDAVAAEDGMVLTL